MRPVFARFPHLCVPCDEIAHLPTPVDTLGEGLWVKRDDLTHPLFAGSKARKLEFFLPRARTAARPLVAVAPEGSNWLRALAQSGLCVRALAFPQQRNDVASRNRAATRAALGLSLCAGVLARAVAELPRLIGRRSLLAPPGGTDPVTTLGFVSAAFELAEQKTPDAVYVPLGSGGTAAGLALGFALAGLSVEVRAVRVTTALVANERRVRALAAATARVLGVVLPELRLTVVHDYVGGGYGHPLARAESLRHHFPYPLDPTYSAKTALAFLEGRERRRLLWLTWGNPTRIS